MLFKQYLVCIRGGGDLATGVAYRLFRAGFPVVILELPQPLVIRRAVAFAQAVYSGEVEVEGVTAEERIAYFREQDSRLADLGFSGPDGFHRLAARHKIGQIHYRHYVSQRRQRGLTAEKAAELDDQIRRWKRQGDSLMERYTSLREYWVAR